MRRRTQLLSAILLILLVAGTTVAQAVNCRNLGVYTDYYNGKPTILIWNGAIRPDPYKMTISYYGSLGRETVPSPSDWGVRTDAPQFENRNGWYGYFIATRWYSYHAFWNDDWRWNVRYCT